MMMMMMMMMMIKIIFRQFKCGNLIFLIERVLIEFLGVARV